MEKFQIIWIEVPIVAALFLGAPWILWQVWVFVSPGLYPREKRLAIPFVLCTAGLFVLGGLFGYFIALGNGLSFLLGIGRETRIVPLISIADYFDIFVDLLLGVGAAFELPVLMFFLTLIHVASPRFLLSHSRHAILAIVILASALTPSPDAFTMALFAGPMIVLFYLGLLASYMVVRKREGRWPFRFRRA